MVGNVTHASHNPHNTAWSNKRYPLLSKLQGSSPLSSRAVRLGAALPTVDTRPENRLARRPKPGHHPNSGVGQTRAADYLHACTTYSPVTAEHSTLKWSSWLQLPNDQLTCGAFPLSLVHSLHHNHFPHTHPNRSPAPPYTTSRIAGS